MKKTIAYILCLLMFATVPGLFTNHAYAEKTASQSGLNLPTGFPAMIPFADDAYNVNGTREKDDYTISADYQTDKKMADVVTMYKNFIKMNDKNFTETQEQKIVTYAGNFQGFQLGVIIMNLGKTSVFMTVHFTGGVPDQPVYTGTASQAKEGGSSASGIATNQSRLKLPAFFPKDIPFTKDAVLSIVDDRSCATPNNQSINIVYNSNTGNKDVMNLYKNFTRNNAKSNNELQSGDSYLFNSTFEQYGLQIAVNGGSGQGKSRVTLSVTPKDGFFQNHLLKTDYSDGKIDKSGITDPNRIVRKRLIAGPRLTDPDYTNLFVRKSNGSLWGYGTWLFYDATQKGVDKVANNQKWMLVDENAYCSDTESRNYFLVKPDESLWTYGDNDHYLLGNGEIVTSKDCPPTKVLDGVRIADIGKNGIAVKKDGSLWIWGVSNPAFSVLNAPDKDRLVPEKVMDNVADAVQSGCTSWTTGGMVMVLKMDGSVWAWGEGNCGDGGVTPFRKSPIKVMNGVKTINASISLCCVIKNDNSLWVWESHITSANAGPHLLKPKKILSDVKMVSPGDSFLVALKNDGTVWTFGTNTSGQCGIGSLKTKYLSNPQKILDGAAEVEAADRNAFALMKDGKIYGWGRNNHFIDDDYDWVKTKDAKVLKPTYIGFTAD